MGAFLAMPENAIQSEPTRQAESKVIPPPRTDLKYPEVAVIPHGSGSVVMIPKGPEVVQPKAPELPEADHAPVDLPKKR